MLVCFVSRSIHPPHPLSQAHKIDLICLREIHRRKKEDSKQKTQLMPASSLSFVNALANDKIQLTIIVIVIMRYGLCERAEKFILFYLLMRNAVIIIIIIKWRIVKLERQVGCRRSSVCMHAMLCVFGLANACAQESDYFV